MHCFPQSGLSHTGPNRSDIHANVSSHTQRLEAPAFIRLSQAMSRKFRKGRRWQRRTRFITTTASNEPDISKRWRVRQESIWASNFVGINPSESDESRAWAEGEICLEFFHSSQIRPISSAQRRTDLVKSSRKPTENLLVPLRSRNALRKQRK